MAVLGRQDAPTDAVEEYCHYLGTALAAEWISMECKHVPWAEVGWPKAMRGLNERNPESNNPAWFLLQYTALSWSRRGFSVRFLRVIRLLKNRGARCAVVFHDAEAYSGNSLVARIRRVVQTYTMRKALQAADLVIFTIPAKKISWVPPNARNMVFIPVGANLPSPETAWEHAKESHQGPPAVAIFSLSDGAIRAEEVRLIAEAVRYAAERIGKLQVVVLGRNSELGGRELKEKFVGTSVETIMHGVLPAREVVRVLARCDVMLFVRGQLSARRSSAIAGIACGLPVVAQEGRETAAPITEAGVVLVPERAAEGLGPALLRVLSDKSYRASLAEKSKRAQERYFSWRAIAATYAMALRTREMNH